MLRSTSSEIQIKFPPKYKLCLRDQTGVPAGCNRVSGGEHHIHHPPLHWFHISIKLEGVLLRILIMLLRRIMRAKLGGASEKGCCGPVCAVNRWPGSIDCMVDLPAEPG